VIGKGFAYHHLLGRFAGAATKRNMQTAPPAAPSRVGARTPERYAGQCPGEYSTGRLAEQATEAFGRLKYRFAARLS
jgi:hypothetical protein